MERNGNLILTVDPGQPVVIGDDIAVTFLGHDDKGRATSRGERAACHPRVEGCEGPCAPSGAPLNDRYGSRRATFG